MAAHVTLHKKKAIGVYRTCMISCYLIELFICSSCRETSNQFKSVCFKRGSSSCQLKPMLHQRRSTAFANSNRKHNAFQSRQRTKHIDHFYIKPLCHLTCSLEPIALLLSYRTGHFLTRQRHHVTQSALFSLLLQNCSPNCFCPRPFLLSASCTTGAPGDRPLPLLWPLKLRGERGCCMSL